MSLAVENILGIIDRDGEEELALDLSSFSCGVNDEIQTFLTDKAIEFARKKMSITYLVSDDEDSEENPHRGGDLTNAFFALAELHQHVHNCT